MKHSDIWKRDSTTEGDKLFTQINGEWLELKPISPEDIKTLKEALEWHESVILRLRTMLESCKDNWIQSDPNSSFNRYNDLHDKIDHHTRIAEALRRVVG